MTPAPSFIARSAGICRPAAINPPQALSICMFRSFGTADKRIYRRIHGNGPGCHFLSTDWLSGLGRWAESVFVNNHDGLWWWWWWCWWWWCERLAARHRNEQHTKWMKMFQHSSQVIYEDVMDRCACTAVGPSNYRLISPFLRKSIICPALYSGVHGMCGFWCFGTREWNLSESKGIAIWMNETSNRLARIHHCLVDLVAFLRPPKKRISIITAAIDSQPEGQGK